MAIEASGSVLKRFLPAQGGRNALKIYLFLLLLALGYTGLVLAGLVSCNGEGCFVGPLALLLWFPGGLLYWLAPHFYWDIATVPGFHVLQIPLSFICVYYAGKGLARLVDKVRNSKQSKG